MAKKNESGLKKVGRFVTNELLGVDDARRAVNKARKGDFKGALKSAAAGALELGSTVTVAGKGGMLGAKAGLAAGKKSAAKSAQKTGQEAGRRMAEKIPSPKYPSAEAKTKTVRAESVQVTSKSGAKSTTPAAKKATVIGKKPSEKARLGNYEGAVKRRQETINKTATSAKEASYATSKTPGRGKAVGAAAGASAGIASKEAVKSKLKKK